MSSLLNIEMLFDLSKNNYSFTNDMIIIAGPTGIGKSKIAIELAKSSDYNLPISSDNLKKLVKDEPNVIRALALQLHHRLAQMIYS